MLIVHKWWYVDYDSTDCQLLGNPTDTPGPPGEGRPDAMPPSCHLR